MPDIAGATEEAFREESGALLGALARLPGPAWDRRTRCDPWRVRDVVAHVTTVLARVPAMIASPAPARPDTTATGYYRADHRFSDTANADRVRTSQQRAAVRDAPALVRDLSVTAESVITQCRREPIGRIVATRHGDAMLLSEFLSTRVVELAVHGLTSRTRRACHPGSRPRPPNTFSGCYSARTGARRLPDSAGIRSR